MPIQSVAEADVKGKKVLLRVDFNVELDDVAHVQESFRFQIVKPTIDLLIEKGAAHIALLSHHGRPDGKPDPKHSLSRLLEEAKRLLEYNIEFIPDCIGEKVAAALSVPAEGKIWLLENVRFYPGEETNDPEFGEALAAPFEIYINEAFSVSHRANASVSAVTAFLPSFAGIQLMKEIQKLDALKQNPPRPAIAIIGGAKIETKLPLIRTLEPIYDCILVGGKIANEAIDQKISFSEKVLLPQDFNAPERLDIGPNTAAYYAAIIQKGKTIVWNGPMGKFEEKPYDFGTNVILNAILESSANVVIGGGESLAVLEKAGVFHRIGFVSSGGGAMLEYLAGSKLPGLIALEQPPHPTL